eukprot:4668624-Pyramimonas_sp.AAC.3
MGRSSPNSSCALRMRAVATVVYGCAVVLLMHRSTIIAAASSVVDVVPATSTTVVYSSLPPATRSVVHRRHLASAAGQHTRTSNKIMISSFVAYNNSTRHDKDKEFSDFITIEGVRDAS